MSYSLRPYQQAAVDYAIPRLQASKAPLLMSIGTGAGKTWIISEIAKQWKKNVLVLTISRELCYQDYEKLKLVAGEEKVGLYSASWKSKDVKPITVATIQSAHRHPEIWKSHRLLILDECDNLGPDGMLGDLLTENTRVLGLTATAYATQGSFNGHWYVTKIYPLHKIQTKNYGWFWKPVEFCISEKQLTKQGYLCPLKMYSSPINCNVLKINSNGSEYTSDSIDAWIQQTYERIMTVMEGAEEHGMCKSGIVFMPTVESCEQLEAMCLDRGLDVAAVSHKTKAKEREIIVDSHKAGQIKWLINQGVFTRGFDAPDVDCLVIARPTRSLRLWRQILGRGVRLAEGKKHCNVLDLTTNSETWGGMDSVVMGKNGWCDTILLNGKDISGMEVGRIKLTGNRFIPRAPQRSVEETEPITRRKNGSK